MADLKAFCGGGNHYPETLHIFPAVRTNPDGSRNHPDSDEYRTEIAVLCNNAGRSTGIWSDGTVGVPPHIEDACLDEEDYVFCPDHQGHEINWHSEGK